MNKNNEKNLYVYVRTAVHNKMACVMTSATSLQLKNFRRVYEQVPLFTFRQCEDYSQRSKPYFEPLTFAWQRCLLQREYSDFVFIFIEYLYCVWLRFMCVMDACIHNSIYAR